MGSFDIAKICELVGIHILFLLSNKLDKQSTGLYRDDGLAILRNTSIRKTDWIRKNITEIFKDADFKIEFNLNFNDIQKSNIWFIRWWVKTVYETKWPAAARQHLIKPSTTDCKKTTSIYKQSFIKEFLKQAGFWSKIEYEKGRRESGHKNVSVNYADKKDIKQKRNRSRNIIWVNPHFNKKMFPLT